MARATKNNQILKSTRKKNGLRSSSRIKELAQRLETKKKKSEAKVCEGKFQNRVEGRNNNSAKVDDEDNFIPTSSVTSPSVQTDLNDLYLKQWDEMVHISQNIYLEDAINDEYSPKEVEAYSEKHSSQMSSSQISNIFSSPSTSSLPSSQTTKSNREKGSKSIEDIQSSYCFKLSKQGFKMHKTMTLSSKDVEILQGYEFAMSNVYVVDSSHVLNYINERVNDDKVVLKVHNKYSLSFLHKNVNWQNDIVNCVVDEDSSYGNLQLNGTLKNYLTELECYKKLNKNPEFNSISYD